jgi:hypothetical protein
MSADRHAAHGAEDQPGPTRCVIRRKRTPVPSESGHPFRFIPDTVGTAPKTISGAWGWLSPPWSQRLCVRHASRDRAR